MPQAYLMVRKSAAQSRCSLCGCDSTYLLPIVNDKTTHGDDVVFIFRQPFEVVANAKARPFGCDLCNLKYENNVLSRADGSEYPEPIDAYKQGSEVFQYDMLKECGMDERERERSGCHDGAEF